MCLKDVLAHANHFSLIYKLQAGNIFEMAFISFQNNGYEHVIHLSHLDMPFSTRFLLSEQTGS